MSLFLQDGQLQADGVGQCLLAHRLDDAAGAQHRDASFDTKARVVGLGCQLHALRNLHQRTQSHRFPLWVTLAHLLNLLANHPARDQIDGSFADRHLQAGLGDVSHAHAAADGNARAVADAQGDKHLDAVGDVRVVAAVLADARLCPTLAGLQRVDRDGKRESFGDGKLHALRVFFPKQRPCRRLCCGCRTAAGGVAAAQLLLTDIDIGILWFNPVFFQGYSPISFFVYTIRQKNLSMRFDKNFCQQNLTEIHLHFNGLPDRCQPII